LPDQESALRLIDRIYQAAVDPAGWQVVAEELRREFHAVTANVNLLIPGATGGDCMKIYGSGYDPAMLKSYLEEWSEKDILADRARSLEAGTVVWTGELIPVDEFRRLPFYFEQCRPQEISGDGIVGILERDRAIFGVHRAERARRPFGEAELSLARLIAPHMLRAYQVRKTLALAEESASGAGAAAVVDRLTIPVIVLDESGRIARPNRAAEALFAEEDGLERKSGCLHPWAADGRAALGRAIARALDTASGSGTSAGGLVALRRPSGRRPLAALVTPLSRAAPLAGVEGGGAAVFIVDPETRSAPPARVLARLFGLSEAESRVAIALAAGRSPKQVAGERGLALPTVRAQLRNVLAKTGTDGQASLARLLAKLALLPEDGGGDPTPLPGKP